MSANIARSVDLSVVGANGGAWCTDLGVAAPGVPASSSVQPASPWTPMGAVSEDGLQYGFDETDQTFLAWGQLSSFRTQITQSLRTFDLTLWETNRAICKSVMYRLPVSTVAPSNTGDYAFQENAAPSPDRRSWIFDVFDGNVLERFYVPTGEVTKRENILFKKTEISAYKLTITAYADGSNNTVYHLGHIVAPAS